MEGFVYIILFDLRFDFGFLPVDFLDQWPTRDKEYAHCMGTPLKLITHIWIPLVVGL